MKAQVMKKLIFMIMMFAVANTANAQSDFEVAQSFMSKKGVTLVNNGAVSRRATASNNQYSIFKGEDGKGFAIVVNGSIVGYSTEDEMDANNLPPQLKEMLDNYPKTSTRRAGNNGYPDWFTPRNVTPIEPMLTTQWGQYSPYNDLLQLTGICSGVAKVQILHYYRVPRTYLEFTWESRNQVFPITTFNHDLMLDKYVEGSYTEEQGYEVAKLYYYVIGLESFNPGNSIFRLKQQPHEPNRDSVDIYLENSHPLFVMGGDSTNLWHAYVIDGRDSDGLYHANWGWDGWADGYYVYAKKYKDVDRGESERVGWFSWDFWFQTYIPDDYTASITRVERKIETNGTVYNLQGQKVGDSLNGLPKGVYIKGGKKIIIK